MVALTTALVLGAGLLPHAAAAPDDEQLRQRREQLDTERSRLSEEAERVEAQRARISAALGEATAAVDRLTGELNRLQDEARDIEREVGQLEQTAAKSREHLARRVSALYRGSVPNEFLGLMAGTSMDDLTARSHYLSALTRSDRAELETAAAVGRRLTARRADLREVVERRESVAQEARLAQAELDRQLAGASAALEETRSGIAVRDQESRQLAGELESRREAREAAQREAAEERRAAERAARRRQAPSRSAATASPSPESSESSESSEASESPAAPRSAPASPAAPAPAPAPAPAGRGGMACPQDHPRSFTDTWGAPRSGGRRHRGTDIFGAMGGNVFAITSGTIEWTRTGSSAGLWLSLRGDDGDRYWYMHLSGFVVGAGQRVGAGELIASNGNTGNARGTSPHIHFEHHPGGGAAVNPYALLRRVCG